MMLHSFCRRIDEICLSQSFVFPHVNQAFFDHLFSDNWFSILTIHFHFHSDFEHCSHGRYSSPRVFVGWQNADMFSVPPSHRSAFYAATVCLVWEGAGTHRSVLNSTPLVFSYYSVWVFDYGLFQLIHTVANSKIAVCAVAQFLLATSSCNTHSSC